MNKNEQKIVGEIFGYGKRKYLLEAMGQLTRLLLLLLLLWLSISLADQLFYFSEITRWGLLIINGCLILVAIYSLLIRPFQRYLFLNASGDLSDIARQIGIVYPEISDALVNLYQLIRDKADSHVSSELRHRAIEKSIENVSAHNFSSRLQVKTFLPNLKAVLAVLFSTILLLLFRFDEIKHSSLRLINPGNEYLIIPEFSFNVDPGNARIIKGQLLNINAAYSGPRLKGSSLYLFSGDLSRQLRKIEMAGDQSSFDATLHDINEDMAYRIKGVPQSDLHLSDHLWSGVFHIKVLIPPVVKNMDISLTPPAYSGLPKFHQDRNIGDIAALAGTKVKMRVIANKRIQQADVVFGSDRKIPLEVKGDLVIGQFIINENDHYTISLTDTSGLQNINPIEYQIAVLADNAPFVEITDPGEDIEGQLDQTIRLKIEATDDFGFAKVNLNYRFQRGSESAADTNWQKTTLPLNKQQTKHLELSHYWDFTTLPLAFDDGIEYFASALDNNRVGGPAIGTSKHYFIRFPSLEDFFDSFSQNQEKEIDRFEDVTRDAEEIKKNLEEINRELKQSTKLDWEKKKEIESTLEQQQELHEKIEDIQKNLEEMIEQLDNKDLISEQVLEKYQQLQDLFQELATPELKNAMKKLQQAMEKSNPSAVQKAMEEFKLQQEAFEKNIERTMELLKQVQFEQKMDELVQKANNLVDQQQKISNKLEEENPLSEDDFGQLEKNQNQQEESLEGLKQDLDQFLEEPLLSKYPRVTEKMDSISSAMDDEILKQNMDQAIANLAQKNQSKSKQNSQRLQKQMQEIRNSLSASQQQMQQQGKTEVMQKMARAMRRMLKLSNNQEQLLRDTKKTSPLSEQFNRVLKEQGQNLDNFQKVISEMVQLSKETFFLSPQISKSLGKAQSSMGKSLNELSERNKNAAARHQEGAMSALNEGVMSLRKSMSQLSQSQSGTGFEEFLEQMQQMASGQGQINQESLNLMQGEGNQGQYSVQQQAQMQRLAAQQAALSEAMEKMGEQAGNRKDVMGRLGELSSEMDEIVKDLLKQNVDRKTIERQRQILSRMLDAQKSLEEREFSKKRKARQARRYSSKDPGKLGETIDQKKQRIQNALRRALNEGYDQDYQKLIEAYFKELLRQSNQADQ